MPAHRLGLLAGAAFRGLLVSSPPLHLAKGALALHFLLQHPEGRVDVVVAHENLHRGPILSLMRRGMLGSSSPGVQSNLSAARLAHAPEKNRAARAGSDAGSTCRQ